MDNAILGLNVWLEEESDEGAITKWSMTLYPVYNGNTDSSAGIPVQSNMAMLERYLEISSDEDWWVYDGHPDFHYILFGTK